MDHIKNIIYLVLISIILTIIIYRFIHGESITQLYSSLHDDDYQIYNRLYLQFDRQYSVIHNAMPQEVCKLIKDEGDTYATANGWSARRYAYYPTVDNQITEEWQVFSDIELFLESVIYPSICNTFDISGTDKLGLNEVFIVKYDMSGQLYLEPHRDGSEFSFIVALNDKNEYNGGGTRFCETDTNVKLGVGECLVFNGQNEHSGISITDGTRFILAGFIHYKDADFSHKFFVDY